MKISNLSLCGLAACVLIGLSCESSVAQETVVLARLNLAGKVTVNQGGNSNNGNVTKLAPTTIRYNIKDIVKLLNNSPAFVGYLQFQTATNYSQIPSGAYLALDLYGKNVWVVLKNGSPLVPLAGDFGTNTFAFGRVDFSNISATYKYSNNTRAGSETDLLSEFNLSFDDYNSPATSFSAQGTATLKSTTGKASNIVQKLNQSLQFEGTGDGRFNNQSGTGSQKATASGKATIPTSYWPFWNFYQNPV